MKKIRLLFKLLIIITVITISGCSTQSGVEDPNYYVDFKKPSPCSGTDPACTVRVKAKTGTSSSVIVYSKAIIKYNGTECNGNIYPGSTEPWPHFITSEQWTDIYINIFALRCNFPGTYKIWVAVENADGEKKWKEVCDYNYTDPNFTYPNCTSGSRLNHDVEYDYMSGYDIRNSQYSLLTNSFNDANVNIEMHNIGENPYFEPDGLGTQEGLSRALQAYRNQYYDPSSYQLYYIAGINKIKNCVHTGAFGVTLLGHNYKFSPAFVLTGKCHEGLMCGDKRTISASIHELGHQIAINHHCSSPSCVMKSSLSLTCSGLLTEFCDDHKCFLYYTLK